MTRTVFALSVSALALLLSAHAYQIPYVPEPSSISRIRQEMPGGWQCILIREYGKKGHPHGLKRPILRADFTAPQRSFLDEGKRVSPLIQLYLYDIRDKHYVLWVIDRERFFSWDIPIYFGETKDYIVVTSPSYVNHGIFTEEAKRAICPMWKVLRKHIPNKGDNSVDELGQP